MAETIYIYLEDEGTEVWRPAPAWRIGGSSYIVLRPDEYDPEIERWQSPPRLHRGVRTKESVG